MKCCLDAPLLIKKDDEYVRQSVLDTGDLQVLSHYGGEFKRNPDGTVNEDRYGYYRPFVRALFDIGYKGYLGYELCHRLPVVNGQTVGLDFVDDNSQMAADFMNRVIADTKKERAQKLTRAGQPTA